MTQTPNRSLVVYCLYLAGGATGRVHTEDVALKCWELYPDSFSWTKYHQYCDKDIVRVALTDARKENAGLRVSGRVEGQSSGIGDPDGWTLTDAGLSWVREHSGALDLTASGKTERKSHRQVLLKRVHELKEAPIFRSYTSNPAEFQPLIGELAAFLRCRVDAALGVWERRFTELRRVGIDAGDAEIEQFVLACQEAHAKQR